MRDLDWEEGGRNARKQMSLKQLNDKLKRQRREEEREIRERNARRREYPDRDIDGLYRP